MAIWRDGRIVFARHADRWTHEFHEGRLPAATVATLEKRVTDTGVLALNGMTYLVRAAAANCRMVDFGTRLRQALYWDEVETPGDGITSTRSLSTFDSERPGKR